MGQKRKPLQGSDVVHLVVRLRPKFHRELREQAVREDRPVSVLVREALGRYLEAARSA